MLGHSKNADLGPQEEWLFTAAEQIRSRFVFYIWIMRGIFSIFPHLRSRPLGHNRARPDVRNNVLGKAVYRRTRTLSVQIKLTHSHFRTLLGLFVLTAWLSGGFRRIINSPSPSVCSVHLHGLPFNYRHMGPAREPRRRWTHFEDIT